MVEGAHPYLHLLAPESWSTTSPGSGLEVIDEHETSVTLMGGGGHVSGVACSGEKKTTLELETREWDYPVRQFMREVS
jgi:hypothetical protein